MHKRTAYTLRTVLIMFLFAAVGNADQIYELAYSDSDDSWLARSVGSEANAVPAIGSAMTSTTYDGDPRIYYVGDDNMIQELAYSGGNWLARSVGSEAKAVPAIGSAMTSTTYDGDPRIYYFGIPKEIKG